MATILIVDDEKNIRTSLALYLETLGHEVESAEDAVSALARLKAGRFDVVLSDIRMAGMDGLAFLRRVHAQQPDIAVVLMTAYPTVPQAVEAMHAGAYEYLMKPFSPEDVRLLINHVLDVKALQRQSGASPSATPPASAGEPASESAETSAHQSEGSLKDIERQEIERALAESPTLTTAAARLGIDPSTLWRKRRRYGMH